MVTSSAHNRCRPPAPLQLVDNGFSASPGSRVVAMEDWLANGLGGRAAKTIKKNENVL